MISRFANALELGIVGLDAQGRVRMWNRWMAERSGGRVKRCWGWR